MISGDTCEDITGRIFRKTHIEISARTFRAFRGGIFRQTLGGISNGTSEERNF